MKKPYLKRYTSISGFTVWVVDGKYIRENIDEEFTNFGANYRFKFIPEKELWIDKEYGEEKEIDYYVLSLMTMIKLLSKGKTHKQALEIADKIEQRERKKSLHFKAIKQEKDKIQKIHKKLIKEYSKGKIKVWIVKGVLVRDLFFLDFTEGGHNKVYSFVPENEVWLDDDLSRKERKFVLLHELHERNLMSKGWKYTKAHFDSSDIEYHCRHHPEQTSSAIKVELKKANSTE